MQLAHQVQMWDPINNASSTSGRSVCLSRPDNISHTIKTKLEALLAIERARKEHQ